jgi:hypothetical protein
MFWFKNAYFRKTCVVLDQPSWLHPWSEVERHFILASAESQMHGLIYRFG